MSGSGLPRETLIDGQRLHQAGRLAEAIIVYEQIASASADDADVCHFLGLALHQSGRRDEGLALMHRSVELRPDAVSYYSNLGAVLRERGEIRRAAETFEAALRLRPGHPVSLNNLALVYRDCGDFRRAEACLREALKHDGSYLDARLNLAEVLIARGQGTEAAEILRAVLQVNEGNARAHTLLANQLTGSGQELSAEHHARRALAINPGNPDGWRSLGECLEGQRRFSEAFQALQEGLRRCPNDATILTNLGGLMGRQLKHDDAIRYLNQALQAKPDHLPALVWLALANGLRGYATRAIEVGQRAVELGVRSSDVYFAVAGAYVDLAEHTEAASWYKEGNKRELEAGGLSDVALLPSLYGMDESGLQTRRKHLEWGQRAAEHAGKPCRPPVLARRDKLKIGFVSGDFRVHSVAYFIGPLFQSFDDREFEFHAFSNTFRTDSTTDRLRQTKVRWHDMVKLKDSQAAEFIRSQGIDVLIDLSGHTTYNRLPVFAVRPAAVQATYLGYPATTGLASVDFRITDVLADPLELQRIDDYSERLARMKRCAWCYEPPESMPPIETSEGRELRLGCLNSFSKVSDKTLNMWGQVMAALPHATLLLKSRVFVDIAAQARVLERFASVGVDGARLRFGSFVPGADEHCRVFNEIDISLDPYPYHGTTTTCESLWMGVPVVTLAGQHHVSRVGVSLLTAVGLADRCIATTEQEYVEKVVRLAREADWRTWFRNEARNVMRQSPLMDFSGFATAFTALVCQQYELTIGS